MKSVFDATLSICMDHKDFIKHDLEPLYIAIAEDVEVKHLMDTLQKRLGELANQHKVPCKVKINLI